MVRWRTNPSQHKQLNPSLSGPTQTQCGTIPLSVCKMGTLSHGFQSSFKNSRVFFFFFNYSLLKDLLQTKFTFVHQAGFLTPSITQQLIREKHLTTEYILGQPRGRTRKLALHLHTILIPPDSTQMRQLASPIDSCCSQVAVCSNRTKQIAL